MAKKGKKQKAAKSPENEEQENISPKENLELSSKVNVAASRQSILKKSGTEVRTIPSSKSVTIEEHGGKKHAKKGKQKKADGEENITPKKKKKTVEVEELKEIVVVPEAPEGGKRESILLEPQELTRGSEERKSRVQIIADIRSRIELRMSMMQQATETSLTRSDSVIKRAGAKRKGSRQERSKSRLTVTSEISDESSEETSLETLEEKEEKQRKKGKKKEQKKKGKAAPDDEEEGKGKKPKKEEAKKEEAPIKELDPIAQLKRMISLAKELNISLPQISEDLIKGPKRKGKKEKGRPTAEMLEKARIEAEAQAKRIEELMKKKREEERLAAMEKEKKDAQEHFWRIEQLEKSCHFINELTEFNNDLTRKAKEETEWQKYVECGRLPNPSTCDQMNTYLHLWEKAMVKTTIEEASSRTRDVIELLNELDELIDTATGPDLSKVDNWKWVRKLFREHQRDSLNVTTYHLLRDVEHNLHRINIPTADYNFKDEFLILCIWLRVQLPVPLPNPRRPPKPRIDISLEMLEMDILFPIAIDGENAAVRGMYLKYDHLSDTSSSYNMPDVPPEFQMNILEFMKKENRIKLKYKYDQRDKKEKKVEVPRSSASSAQTETAVAQYSTPDEKEKPPETVAPEEKEDFGSDEEIPTVPFKQLKPTASEYAIGLEDELYSTNRQKLTLDLDDSILNLRRFKILGGVFHIDLLAQPPQPQDFITMEMTITALHLPKGLETVPFHVSYIPPASSDSSVRKLPEEIEEEMKRQEEEFDKLLLITLKWPQHVIFLELPIVVYWDEDEKEWTKSEVHDVKHNEEKSTLTFRTGIFGVFGLATYKYVNLPFQAYDLKPEADGSVSLQLTAAILMLEFNVKDGKICLSQLQNSPNNALQDIVGTYFELHKLKRVMQDAGIDIYPDFDAFCYVEGSCEKHWSTERHLYYNIAQMANCFNFSWSRWNIQAGRRKIVLQMREYAPTKTKQKNHQMLLVTPLKATFVECTEVSQVFSEKELEGTKFSADLYHLMKFTSGIHTRNRVMQASKENVYALSQLLVSTRVLSFS